jgi:hypothetical protein
MAKLSVSCSWCHEFNDVSLEGRKLFCWSCAHRADVPRKECDCRRCRAKIVETISRKAAQFREAS